MGRHMGERKEWFPEDVTPAQPFDPVPKEYRPLGHTGRDYSAGSVFTRPRREVRNSKAGTFLSIVLGMAIGLFTAALIYLYIDRFETSDAFTRAFMVFNGAGIMLAGIVVIALACIHIYRSRRKE